MLFRSHANRDYRQAYPSYGFDHLEISDEPGVYEDAYRAWVRRQSPEALDHISVGLPPARKVWRDLMGEDDGVNHPSGRARDDLKGAIPFKADANLTHSAFVAQRTIEYLRQQDRRQPFLCIAGFYSPHAPWVVPQQFLDLYDRESLSLPNYPPEIDAQRPTAPSQKFSDAQLRSAKHGYYAMISEVDYHIGRILQTLDECGLSDDTIIVFTSDHGEWLGDHLRFAKGYPGDDSTRRVAIIFKVPQAPTQCTVSHLVGAVDILPTLLDLIGVQIPPHLQGHSIAPLLLGREYAPRDAVLTEGNGWKALRTATYRYLLHADGHEMLWDLAADPGEYHDIAADTAYSSILVDCRHRMLTYLLTIERPLPRTFPY